MISDLLKHIRLVHFFLIFTCIVVIIAKYSYNPDQIFRAYEQIVFIREVTNNWNQKFVQNLSEKTVEKYLKDKINSNTEDIFKTQHFNARIDNKEFSFNVIFQNKNWTLRASSQPFESEINYSDIHKNYQNNHDIEQKFDFDHDEDLKELKSSYISGFSDWYDRKLFLKQPKTLNEFIEFWNDFAPPTFIYIPIKLGKYLRIDYWNFIENKVVDAKIILDELKRDNNGTGKQIQNVKFKLIPKLKVGERDQYGSIPLGVISDSTNLPEEKWPLKDKSFTHEFYFLSVDANFENTEDDDWKFDIVYKSILRCRIPVFTDKIKLNLQKHLFNEYQYPSSIKSGKFIDVFNELYEVTEDLRDLKIVDLEKFINSRKKTAGGNVEIYFTKFPVGSINLFGSVIILIIQFYLWINLRHLRIIKIRIAHQQKEDIQLHWIALLSDNYAIGFTLITFIAPCVVTFFLNLFFGFLSTFLSSLIIVWWMKINGLKIIKII